MLTSGQKFALHEYPGALFKSETAPGAGMQQSRTIALTANERYDAFGAGSASSAAVSPLGDSGLVR